MTNSLRKLLITGGAGQVSQALRAHTASADFAVQTATRQELDITDAASIDAAIAHWMPQTIINTAAYTAVDKAETARDEALRVNQLGAKNLASACQKYRIPLIHLSTDYVFDGQANQPYREDQTANPLGVYGESKWLGEQAIREHCEQHLILRVSAIFSEYGHNFLKTILRLALQKSELNVVADQITCPTYAGHIAGVIYALVKQQASVWGTYHYCDAPPASWHEFAQAILNEAQKHTTQPLARLHAIPASEYVTPAKRPRYSVLDCHKIRDTFGLRAESWQDAIKHIVPLLLS